MSIQSLLGSNSAEDFTIHATDSVKSAAEQMRQHGITALVVKSDEALKGIYRIATSCTRSRGAGRQQSPSRYWMS